MELEVGAKLRLRKLRTGTHFPSFLEPRRMAEKALTAVIPMCKAAQRVPSTISSRRWV